MDFLNKIKWGNVLKVAGLALVGVVVITVAFRLVGSTLFGSSNYGLRESASVSMAPGLGYGGSADVKGYEAYDEGQSLSIRNVTGEPSSIMPVEPDVTPGNDAEAFEVTSYGASIETRDLERTCGTVADLKSRDYVIFENANDYDRGCSFTFKVRHDNVEEILAIILDLNPKDFSENTYTIKNSIEDYTSEEQILIKKLETIDATLDKATSAYDDLTSLATRVQDVESLANIINSKINIVERLTQERININAQLERLQRAKADQLDRLEYTYFNVSVFENKFVDWENLKDSWKNAVQNFVWDINNIVQGVSVQLVTLMLRIMQIALYLVIVLVVVKYGWKLAKYIWHR
ncbi:MAG: hypothetical protein V1738_04280 [Patescibacteria group bacterium]